MAKVIPKKPAPKKAAKPAIASKKKAKPEVKVPLSDLERRFAQEYVVDLNGTQAWLRTKPGSNEASARVTATRLLARANVADEVARLKAERSKRTEVSADIAVKEAWAILTADPRELMEFRVGCCRYCWGKDYLYQRTDSEFANDKAENALANRTMTAAKKPGTFRPLGGAGFDLKRDPNPQCPACAGEGKGRTVFKDTRHISAAAASLFAGVKETKEGLEIKLHSKDAAMDKVFRHLGLYNDKLQVNMPTVLVKDMTGRKSE